LPAFRAIPAIASGSLAQIPMDYDVPGAPIQLVYACDAISSTRVHPLIDFAANEVAERHKPGRSRTTASESWLTERRVAAEKRPKDQFVSPISRSYNVMTFAYCAYRRIEFIHHLAPYLVGLFK